MKRTLSKLIALLTLTTLLGGIVLTANAAETMSPKAKKPVATKPAKPRAKLYRGTVSALDKVLLTITVTNKSSKRVFYVTSETRFYNTKKKPATFGDIKIGNDVAGSYRMKGDVMDLATMHVHEPKASAKKKRSATSPK